MVVAVAAVLVRLLMFHFITYMITKLVLKCFTAGPAAVCRLIASTVWMDLLIENQ